MCCSQEVIACDEEVDAKGSDVVGGEIGFIDDCPCRFLDFAGGILMLSVNDCLDDVQAMRTSFQASSISLPQLRCKDLGHTITFIPGSFSQSSATMRAVNDLPIPGAEPSMNTRNRDLVEHAPFLLPFTCHGCGLRASLLRIFHGSGSFTWLWNLSYESMLIMCHDWVLLGLQWP